MRWVRIALMSLAVTSALSLLGAVGLFLAQPTSYRIARTRTIAASPAAVAAHLSDLRAFVAWEPWAALPGEHPEVTYSSASSGVGAWVERRVHASRTRTTLTSVSPERIVLTNATSGPLGDGASQQIFELRTVPEGTEVTWALTSDLHGLARALWPLVHLEASVGPEMETALVRLDHACR